MRIFAGLLGGLFLVLGLVGLAGGVVLVLGTSYDNPDYTCTGSSGSSTVSCTTYDDSDTGKQTYALGAGVLGGSLFVGGCALIAGAVAAGRRAAPAPAAPQPVAAGAPPAYGGGWQGHQQSGGNAPSS